MNVRVALRADQTFRAPRPRRRDRQLAAEPVGPGDIDGEERRAKDVSLGFVRLERAFLDLEPGVSFGGEERGQRERLQIGRPEAPGPIGRRELLEGLGPGVARKCITPGPQRVRRAVRGRGGCRLSNVAHRGHCVTSL